MDAQEGLSLLKRERGEDLEVSEHLEGARERGVRVPEVLFAQPHRLPVHHLISGFGVFGVGVLERGSERRESEECEREIRLRALCPPRGHTLGCIGGGDQVARSAARAAALSSGISPADINQLLYRMSGVGWKHRAHPGESFGLTRHGVEGLEFGSKNRVILISGRHLCNNVCCSRSRTVLNPERGVI